MIDVGNTKPCQSCLLRNMDTMLCDGLITTYTEEHGIQKKYCIKFLHKTNKATLDQRLQDSWIPSQLIQKLGTPTKVFLDRYIEIGKDDLVSAVEWTVHQMRTTGGTGVVLAKPWLSLRGIGYNDDRIQEKALRSNFLVIVEPERLMSSGRLAKLKNRRAGINEHTLCQTIIVNH